MAAGIENPKASQTKTLAICWVLFLTHDCLNSSQNLEMLALELIIGISGVTNHMTIVRLNQVMISRLTKVATRFKTH